MPENVWISILLTATSILIGIILAAWRQISALRNNDMHELRQRLIGLDTKLDAHLQWHLIEKTK